MADLAGGRRAVGPYFYMEHAYKSNYTSCWHIYEPPCIYRFAYILSTSVRMSNLPKFSMPHKLLPHTHTHANQVCKRRTFVRLCEVCARTPLCSFVLPTAPHSLFIHSILHPQARHTYHISPIQHIRCHRILNIYQAPRSGLSTFTLF